MAHLYVLSGPDLGKAFQVAPGAVLGRSNECAAVLRDHSVSRLHARLDCEGGRWSLVDLNSRNGIVVAGLKSLRVELVDGATFQLGEVLMRFRAEGPEPSPVEIKEAAAIVEEELVLEGALEAPPTIPAPARPPSGFPKPANPAPELVRTAHAARTPVRGLEQRERGVLQYSKVANRSGLFQADFAQQPWYLKLALVLLALALCALAGWAAFRATGFFKEKVAGPGAETPASEDR